MAGADLPGSMLARLLPLSLLLLAYSPHSASTIHRQARGASTKSCPVMVCPSTSTCQDYYGAPVCVCPEGQHFVKGKCSSSSMKHSDWLDWHNNARAAVGSVPLTWDTDLAKEAQRVADKIGSTRWCSLKHDVRKGQGQNLAGGPQNIGPSENSVGVRKWVAEGRMYKYSKFDGRKGGCSTGRWRDCGHYTQVIWNSTTLIGCGVTRCKSGAASSRIWACNYSPPGNVLTRYPYDQDPCFEKTCPATAKCDSSSGSAVCKCPKGQAIVRGKCKKDPCRGRRCPGDKVCDPSTGIAKCVCPDGTEPATKGSNTCLGPQCLGISCPGASKCVVGPKSAPYCACPAGQVLQGPSCTSSPSDPLMLTTVAITSKDRETKQVMRFSRTGACWNLEKGFKLGSYKILWKAPASLGESPLPGGVEGVWCKRVDFFDKRNCKGISMAWPSGVGNIAKSAKGQFAKAVSIKCG